MIAQAKANAEAAGMQVRFKTAGFGEIAAAFDRERFDTVLCLGNSLPHLLSSAALAQTLADFAACLRPGGKLIVQNRNFDAVLDQRQRWMEPQSYQEGEAEWLFIRFYDFDPDGLITFNMLTLFRQGEGAWQQRATASRLRGLRQAELEEALQTAGYTGIEYYGSLAGSPFDPQSSGNLVITAVTKSEL
jgi:SAM-dependent methyltransferase